VEVGPSFVAREIRVWALPLPFRGNSRTKPRTGVPPCPETPQPQSGAPRPPTDRRRGGKWNCAARPVTITVLDFSQPRPSKAAPFPIAGLRPFVPPANFPGLTNRSRWARRAGLARISRHENGPRPDRGCLHTKKDNPTNPAQHRHRRPCLSKAKLPNTMGGPPGSEKAVAKPQKEGRTDRPCLRF